MPSHTAFLQLLSPPSEGTTTGVGCQGCSDWTASARETHLLGPAAMVLSKAAQRSAQRAPSGLLLQLLCRHGGLAALGAAQIGIASQMPQNLALQPARAMLASLIVATGAGEGKPGYQASA